jgi:hypothetical protein
MANRNPDRLVGSNPTVGLTPRSKTSHATISASTVKINNVVLPRQSRIGINQHSNIAKVTVNTYVKDVYVQASPGPQGSAGPVGPQGGIGPTGPQAGEDEVYSTRVDFVNDNLLYKAEAAVGTANSLPLWRIRRVIVGNDGDITEEWANGNANFVNIWDNRVSLNYS